MKKLIVNLILLLFIFFVSLIVILSTIGIKTTIPAIKLLRNAENKDLFDFLFGIKLNA